GTKRMGRITQSGCTAPSLTSHGTALMRCDAYEVIPSSAAERASPMAKRGQNEGTIYKRADGRYEARISLGDGTRKSHYAKTRAEAVRWLHATLRERDLGLPVARDERQTVGQWFSSWLEMVKPTVKPKTYRSYEQLTRVHLIPGLGRYAL